MNRNRNYLIIFALIVFAILILPMAPQAESSPGSTAKVTPAEPAPPVSFDLPITKGVISSNYGKRLHPILKKERMHNGIDISAPKGTGVFAAADGFVSFAEVKGAWGKVIFISHRANFETRYGQLSEILVEKEQMVKKGQLIGKVGSSGRSTGPHLHFEIRKENKPENPKNYLDFSIIKK